MTDIIEELQNLNFSKIEAITYFTLINHGQLNGSQISKFSKIPRSSIYPALESLYKKGAITQLSSTKPNLYQACNIDLVIENAQKTINQSAEIVKQELEKIKESTPKDNIWNYEGIEFFKSKTKELIMSANHEICIHCHFDIKFFENEIIKIAKHGVRVIVFSHFELDVSNLPIEYYHSPKLTNTTYSILEFLIIVDGKSMLVAYGDPLRNVHGIITENKYLIQTFANYIHNDIYLQKLEKKYGKNLIDNEIMINSIHELTMEEELKKRDRSQIRDYVLYK